MATLNITVLFFAELAELCQTRQASLACEDGATIDDLFDQLIALHPVVRDKRSTVATAVNEHYVDSTYTLQDGDAVALIPPVSGG
ncbi:MAG: molybdopterin converting factor subunit 1 [Phycisphaerales bacterium]|nr:molybdopterin converting factor subunit 1 [Phycisphaerales bacterium]